MTPPPANPETDVIAAIDALERDGIDELVDWQMSDSPAARAERGDWWDRRLRRVLNNLDERTRWRLQEPVRERITGTFSGGAGGGGRAAGMFAITPDGERIDPDADGVLYFHPEDAVYLLGPGGAGSGMVPGSYMRAAEEAVCALAADADIPTDLLTQPQDTSAEVFRAGTVTAGGGGLLADYAAAWDDIARAMAAADGLGTVWGTVADSDCGGNVT